MLISKWQIVDIGYERGGRVWVWIRGWVASGGASQIW